MRDEELRSSLADVVTSAVQRGVPDVSVLRRRIRRRTVRRLVSGAVVVAVIAGIGIGVNASLPSGKASLPRPVVASGGHHRAPAATWFPAEKLPAADAAPSVAPYVVDISELAQPVSVMSAATGKQAAVINPPAGVTYVGVAAAGDGYTFVLAGTAGSQVRFYEVRLGASRGHRCWCSAFRPAAFSIRRAALTPSSATPSRPTPACWPTRHCPR
jgi:hypothetical protein